MLVEVVTFLLIITTALFIHEMGHAISTISQNKKAKVDIFWVHPVKKKN